MIVQVIVNQLPYDHDHDGSLTKKKAIPLTKVKEKCTSEITMFVELFILINADIVLLAESTDDLQINFNILNIYCEAWKVSINCSKLSYLVKGKGKIHQCSL